MRRLSHYHPYGSKRQLHGRETRLNVRFTFRKCFGTGISRKLAETHWKFVFFKSLFGNLVETCVSILEIRISVLKTRVSVLETLEVSN